MVPVPTKFTLTAGTGDADWKLVAFDRALLEAGIGNLNLVKVSSILPPRCTFMERLIIPPGSLTPVAFGAITSEETDATIAAAVAVGVVENTYGVIMEYSGNGTAEDAERMVTEMLHQALAARGLRPQRILSKGIDHRVRRVGCALAAVVLWY
jgi:arginine decarboxylase